MKASELRGKTAEELNSFVQTRQIDLARLKFRHAAGQLEKTHDLKKLKKEVARIKTVAKEKEKVQNAKAN